MEMLVETFLLLYKKLTCGTWFFLSYPNSFLKLEKVNFKVVKETNTRQATIQTIKTQ